jgi:PKD repeat protein
MAGLINIRLFSFCLLFFLQLGNIGQSYGQQGYLKEIRDSILLLKYGKVAHISADNSNLYIVYNSRYMLNVPFIGGEYGQVYYAKLNKQTGQIIDKVKLASTRILNCESALMYNNFLYLGGSVNMPNQPRSAFLMKFNTQSKSIIWDHDFYMGVVNPSPNTILCQTSSIQLNTAKNNVVFHGIGPFQWISGSKASFTGKIDTSGNSGCHRTYGYNQTIPPIMGELKTEPVFVISDSFQKAFILTKDTASSRICIEISNNQDPCLTWWPNARVYNILSSGTHFIETIGSKVLALVDHQTSSTCMVLDTASNIISIKQFIGLRAKSLSTFNNHAALIFVNSIGQNKANEHILIKMDSTLQIVQSKRTFIDTFQINEFSCKSFLDTNFCYSLFSKKSIGANSVYVYKQNLNALSCNEQTFTPLTTTPAVTNTQVIITYTGLGISTNYTTTSQIVGLRDTTYCLSQVSQVPAANFTFPVICLGASPIFTNLSTNNPTSWLWEFSGASNSISTNQNPTVTFTLAGIHNVTLTASNGFGSNTTVKTVTVLPLPNISINNGSVCPGNSYTLNPAGAFTYTYFPLGPIVTPTSISSYSIIGTDINGCVSQNPAICTIGFYPLPTLSISATKTFVCTGEPLVLTAMGAITYSWSNATNTATTIVTPIVQTVYSVSGANSYGCVQSTSISIAVSSCLNNREQLNNEANFDAFPNPVDAELTLSYQGLSNFEQLDIFLYNVLGQNIPIEKSICKSDYCIVDMAKVSNGTYILVVKTGAFLSQKRIVVYHRQ